MGDTKVATPVARLSVVAGFLKADGSSSKSKIEKTDHRMSVLVAVSEEGERPTV